MTNTEEIKKRLDELIKDGVNTDYVSDCEAIDWIIEQLRASLEREEQWRATSEGHFYHKIELQKERNEYRAWLEIIAEAETEKADWYRYTAKEVLAKYNKPENKLD